MAGGFHSLALLECGGIGRLQAGLLSLALIECGGIGALGITPRTATANVSVAVQVAAAPVSSSLSAYVYQSAGAFSLALIECGGIGALATQTIGTASLSFNGRTPYPVVAALNNQQPPLTDFSLPMAWWADPGFNALYVLRPTYSLDPFVMLGAFPVNASLAFTGRSPSVSLTAQHWANSGNAVLTFSGTPLALAAPALIAVDGCGLTLSGHAPSEQHTEHHSIAVGRSEALFTGRQLSFGTGAFSIALIDNVALHFTGYAPGLFREFTVASPQAFPTFTGWAPVVTQAESLGMTNGEATFTGELPYVGYGGLLVPEASSLAFVGLTPDVLTIDFHDISIPNGALTFEAPLTPIEVGGFEFVGSADLALAGYGPQLIIAPRVLAQTTTIHIMFATDNVRRHPHKKHLRHKRHPYKSEPT